jgi:hypothetical protein
MSDYNVFPQTMSYFCQSSTCFIVFIPRPVTTSLVPVCGSWILKLSETGPVHGPSKKGNRTKIGRDLKALNITSVTVISNKRPNINLDVQNQDAPIELIWDSQDYSCAYDALFTILGDMWVFNPTVWTCEFGLMSSFANKLGLGFQQVSMKQKDFEDARNSVQNLLHIKNPDAFPQGTSGIDISELMVYMFT